MDFLKELVLPLRRHKPFHYLSVFLLNILKGICDFNSYIYFKVNFNNIAVQSNNYLFSICSSYFYTFWEELLKRMGNLSYICIALISVRKLYIFDHTKSNLFLNFGDSCLVFKLPRQKNYVNDEPKQKGEWHVLKCHVGVKTTQGLSRY